MARNVWQVEASRLLVSRGADVNAINKKGNTPLYEAMGEGLIRREKEDRTIELPLLSEKMEALDDFISTLREAGVNGPAKFSG